MKPNDSISARKKDDEKSMEASTSHPCRATSVEQRPHQHRRIGRPSKCSASGGDGHSAAKQPPPKKKAKHAMPPGEKKMKKGHSSGRIPGTRNIQWRVKRYSNARDKEVEAMASNMTEIRMKRMRDQNILREEITMCHKEATKRVSAGEDDHDIDDDGEDISGTDECIITAAAPCTAPEINTDHGHRQQPPQSKRNATERDVVDEREPFYTSLMDISDLRKKVMACDGERGEKSQCHREDAATFTMARLRTHGMTPDIPREPAAPQRSCSGAEQSTPQPGECSSPPLRHPEVSDACESEWIDGSSCYRWFDASGGAKFFRNAIVRMECDANDSISRGSPWCFSRSDNASSSVSSARVQSKRVLSPTPPAPSQMRSSQKNDESSSSAPEGRANQHLSRYREDPLRDKMLSGLRKSGRSECITPAHVAFYLFQATGRERDCIMGSQCIAYLCIPHPMSKACHRNVARKSTPAAATATSSSIPPAGQQQCAPRYPLCESNSTPPREGIVLKEFLDPEERAAFDEHGELPPIHGPCILCIRERCEYDVYRACLGIGNGCMQPHRNAIDVSGGYRSDACLRPKRGATCGVTQPMRRFNTSDYVCTTLKTAIDAKILIASRSEVTRAETSVAQSEGGGGGGGGDLGSVAGYAERACVLFFGVTRWLSGQAISQGVESASGVQCGQFARSDVQRACTIMTGSECRNGLLTGDWPNLTREVSMRSGMSPEAASVLMRSFVASAMRMRMALRKERESRVSGRSLEASSLDAELAAIGRGLREWEKVAPPEPLSEHSILVTCAARMEAMEDIRLSVEADARDLATSKSASRTSSEEVLLAAAVSRCFGSWKDVIEFDPGSSPGWKAEIAKKLRAAGESGWRATLISLVDSREHELRKKQMVAKAKDRKETVHQGEIRERAARVRTSISERLVAVSCDGTPPAGGGGEVVTQQMREEWRSLERMFAARDSACPSQRALDRTLSAQAVFETAHIPLRSALLRMIEDGLPVDDSSIAPGWDDGNATAMKRSGLGPLDPDRGANPPWVPVRPAKLSSACTATECTQAVLKKFAMSGLQEGAKVAHPAQFLLPDIPVVKMGFPTHRMYLLNAAIGAGITADMGTIDFLSKSYHGRCIDAVTTLMDGGRSTDIPVHVMLGEFWRAAGWITLLGTEYERALAGVCAGVADVGEACKALKLVDEVGGPPSRWEGKRQSRSMAVACVARVALAEALSLALGPGNGGGYIGLRASLFAWTHSDMVCGIMKRMASFDGMNGPHPASDESLTSNVCIDSDGRMVELPMQHADAEYPYDTRCVSDEDAAMISPEIVDCGIFDRVSDQSASKTMDHIINKGFPKKCEKRLTMEIMEDTSKLSPQFDKWMAMAIDVFFRGAYGHATRRPSFAKCALEGGTFSREAQQHLHLRVLEIRKRWMSEKREQAREKALEMLHSMPRSGGGMRQATACLSMARSMDVAALILEERHNALKKKKRATRSMSGERDPDALTMSETAGQIENMVKCSIANQTARLLLIGRRVDLGRRIASAFECRSLVGDASFRKDVEGLVSLQTIEGLSAEMSKGAALDDIKRKILDWKRGIAERDAGDLSLAFHDAVMTMEHGSLSSACWDEGGKGRGTGERHAEEESAARREFLEISESISLEISARVEEAIDSLSKMEQRVRSLNIDARDIADIAKRAIYECIVSGTTLTDGIPMRKWLGIPLQPESLARKCSEVALDAIETRLSAMEKTSKRNMRSGVESILSSVRKAVTDSALTSASLGTCGIAGDVLRKVAESSGDVRDVCGNVMRLLKANGFAEKVGSVGRSCMGRVVAHLVPCVDPRGSWTKDAEMAVVACLAAYDCLGDRQGSASGYGSTKLETRSSESKTSSIVEIEANGDGGFGCGRKKDIIPIRGTIADDGGDQARQKALKESAAVYAKAYAFVVNRVKGFAEMASAYSEKVELIESLQEDRTTHAKIEGLLKKAGEQFITRNPTACIYAAKESIMSALSRNPALVAAFSSRSPWFPEVIDHVARTCDALRAHVCETGKMPDPRMSARIAKVEFKKKWNGRVYRLKKCDLASMVVHAAMQHVEALSMRGAVISKAYLPSPSKVELLRKYVYALCATRQEPCLDMSTNMETLWRFGLRGHGLAVVSSMHDAYEEDGGDSDFFSLLGGDLSVKDFFLIAEYFATVAAARSVYTTPIPSCDWMESLATSVQRKYGLEPEEMTRQLCHLVVCDACLAILSQLTPQASTKTSKITSCNKVNATCDGGYFCSKKRTSSRREKLRRKHADCDVGRPGWGGVDTLLPGFYSRKQGGNIAAQNRMNDNTLERDCGVHIADAASMLWDARDWCDRRIREVPSLCRVVEFRRKYKGKGENSKEHKNPCTIMPCCGTWSRFGMELWGANAYRCRGCSGAREIGPALPDTCPCCGRDPKTAAACSRRFMRAREAHPRKLRACTAQFNSATAKCTTWTEWNDLPVSPAFAYVVHVIDDCVTGAIIPLTICDRCNAIVGSMVGNCSGPFVLSAMRLAIASKSKDASQQSVKAALYRHTRKSSFSDGRAKKNLPQHR
jgi:hypothetical protein